MPKVFFSFYFFYYFFIILYSGIDISYSFMLFGLFFDRILNNCLLILYSLIFFRCVSFIILSFLSFSTWHYGIFSCGFLE
ncbi:hypothetical protein FTL43_06485 [Campylobacter jejuni]|nr:hypothetical protein [Campylobacter jejuni]ECO5693923.1 hypothetical protein [Campylobacter jejuni]EDP4648064.1 hypothetical protein [Campylobacter jejuni]